MDCTTHTIVQLSIQLGQLITAVHTGIRDVSHGGSLHDIPDYELLDGLVLGASLGAVGAADELDVSTSMLVTSVVPALGGHLDDRGVQSKIVISITYFISLSKL